jgi:WD40 repeat protein
VLVKLIFLDNPKYSHVKAISRYTKIVAMLYHILLYITFSSAHQFTDDSSGIISVAVSRDGQFIASGDLGGEVIAWNGDGESLIKPIEIHSQPIYSLDFSPDSTVLVSGSFHTTSVLWDTKTWQLQGNPINCGAGINCVRYSPSGEYLAIATTANIQIWNPGKRECIAKFQGHTAFDGAHNVSLAWTPNGKQLASSGIDRDPTIQIWDSSTWKQVGEPWKGHMVAPQRIASLRVLTGEAGPS